MSERFLSTQEVADYLHLKRGTLEGWRCGRGGVSLPYHRFGNRVVYAESDVEAFLAAHRRLSTYTSEPAAAGA